MVTGGSGFVGSAIVRRLRADGHEVRVFVRDASRAPDGTEAFVGEVGDPSKIAEAAEGCAAVVHAAGLRSHRASARELGWTNVAGTENVLNASRHAGVARLVAIGCADVTMTSGKRVNWNEDRVLSSQPFDPHARSMARGEEQVIGAGAADMETVVLRPAWVWGAGAKAQLGELCAEGLDAGLPLYGRGEVFVATTHVDNLAHATALALEAEDAAGSVFHVVDQELSLARDFYSDLSQALGLPPPRTSAAPFRWHYLAALWRRRRGAAGAWPTDVVRRARSHSFDQQRAITRLGYAPIVSLAEGMSELATWARAQGGATALAGREVARERGLE